MQITVYLDLIFIINFIADLFVLLLTGVFLRQKIVVWRLMIGAVFDAGMLLFFVLSPGWMNRTMRVVAFIGISLGAILITYGRRDGRLIQKWFLSTTIMILIGNVMNYLKYISGMTTIQVEKWMILFGISVLIIFCLLYCLKKMIWRQKDIYLIEIKHGTHIAINQVYMDTGNFLWDPLFKKPVILLSETFLESCLSEKEIYIVRQYKKKGRLDFSNKLIQEMQKKDCFHEISYESVGESSGKLLCLLIERICIPDVGITLEKQPVAIGPGWLFAGKTYQGLLHQKCI